MPYKDPGQTKAASRRHYERNRERVKARSKQWREENHERYLATLAKWREANPAASTKWRRENPEEAREHAREWYERHAPVAMERVREWQEANPDKVRGYQRLMRARRRGVPFDSVAQAYAAILVGDPCGYCGGPTEHIDHIHAVAVGGTSEWQNLTASCAACNTSKQSKPLLRFLLHRPA